MVCDLDVLEKALAEIIAEVDGQDLERIRPEGTEAVTVEVFAGWVHARLASGAAGHRSWVGLAVQQVLIHRKATGRARLPGEAFEHQLAPAAAHLRGPSWVVEQRRDPVVQFHNITWRHEESGLAIPDYLG